MTEAIQLKTRGELQAMRASGRLLAARHRRRPRGRRARRQHPGGQRRRRDRHRRGGGDQQLPALRRPRRRSRVPGDDLRVGERRGRARHPVGHPDPARRRPVLHRRRLHPGRLARRLARSPCMSATGRPCDGGGRPDRRLRAGDVGRDRRGPRRTAGSATSPPRSSSRWPGPARGRPPVRVGRRLRRARHRHRHAHGAVRGRTRASGARARGSRRAPRWPSSR